MSSVDSQTTVPHRPDYVDARSAELRVRTERAGAILLPAIEISRDVLATAMARQDRLRKRMPTIDGFRPLRDPRIIFRHTDGNPTISIRSREACELAVEPTIWQSDSCLSSSTTSFELPAAAASQSHDEVKCTLKMGTIECNLHYIPASDGVVLVNMGEEPLSVVALPPMENGIQHQVHPWAMMIIDSACWRISDPTSSVELQVLPRPYHPSVVEDEIDEDEDEDGQSAELALGSKKRSTDDVQQSSKRVRGLSGAFPSGSQAVGTVLEHLPALAPHHTTPGRMRPSNSLQWEEQQQQQQHHHNHHQPAIQEIVNKFTDRRESSHSGSAQPLSFPNNGNGSVRSSCSGGSGTLGSSSVVAFKMPIFRPIRSASSKDTANYGNAIGAWSAGFAAHRNLEHNHFASIRGSDAHTMALHLAYKPHKDLANARWCAQAGQAGQREQRGYFLGSVRDAICILTHISSAVAFLAEQGIAHNDIKPANILYTDISWPAVGPYQAAEGGAMLVDFGLAGHSGLANSEGSPWYIAPEYLEQGRRGTPCDVFALGVVMLYLMRRCVLPETWYRVHNEHREWLIKDVHHARDSASRDAMTSWLSEVGRMRDKLEFSDTLYTSSEEAELGSLVHSMLLPLADRITVEELAEATKDWDLELDLDMDLDLDLDLGMDLGLNG